MKIRKHSIAWWARELWFFAVAAAVILMAGLGDAPAEAKAASPAAAEPAQVVIDEEAGAVAEPAKAVEPADPVEAAEPVKAAEPVAVVEPAEDVEPEPAEPAKTYLGQFTTTAYCSCPICCGEWANNRPGGIVYTASGEEAKEGVTVGASWDVLPAGTVIEIEGLGERTVQDKPADWIVERYAGKIIDVYFADHAAALAYGKRTVDVWQMERMKRRF